MAKRGLRSRLSKYGDEEFAFFLRRGFLKGAGYTDAALDKPIVGILSTASDFNPCHATAGQLADRIAAGVREAGGLPFVFPTISIHESFSYPNSMLLRNLMSMDTEEMLKALPLDAAVLIGGCDKTIPAEIMGAISADMPTMIIPVGPMLAGHHEGRVLGACTDCRRLWGSFRAGEIDQVELDRAHDHLMPTAGTCMVMGTASTMAAIAETLGFSLPGTSTAPAVSSERMRLAHATGMHAVTMAKDGSPRPSEFLTPASFRNASAVLQATSGSTNGVVHLAAMAGRAGIRYDLDELDQLGRDVPVLINLKPAGQHFAEHFHAAGSVPALWRRMRDYLDLTQKTVTGETLGEIVDRWPAWTDDEIIRPLDRPVVEGDAIAVLRGSLAPDGAVIKLSAATPKLCQHEGTAVVFSSVADLEKRIDDPNLDVTPDSVLVLQNAGPIGAPGMPESGALPIPKKLATKGVKDMVRISDARMSGTAFGTVVLHVAPEAAAGGPLGLVRDGDRIRLDSAGRKLDLLVEPAELARRKAEWKPLPQPKRGYGRLYHDHVMQSNEGADFDFLRGEEA